MSLDKDLPIRNSNTEGTLVIVDDYDPLKHRLKVKRLVDGKPLELNRGSPNKVDQRKAYSLPNKRILKVGDDPSSPIVEVSEAYSRLGGNKENGFFSFNEGGNFIKGPVSFISMPNQIRMSGVTTLNPLIISGFPSTIVTPLPTCVWSIPGVGAIKPIMKGVLMASTLLAAGGS